MLTTLLRDAATRSPDHAAIRSGTRTLSYQTLQEQSERLARGLGSLGVHAGDRVALVHGNAPEFVITFLAAAAVGAVVVPLNPSYQRDELRFYFDHCQVRAIVTEIPYVPTCESVFADGVRPPIITTGGNLADTVGFEALIARHRAGALAEPAGDGDAVYQYSSGSTGRPKRVPRTHAQLAAEARSAVETMAIRPDDRIFCTIPLFHTHGQGNCMLAALGGAATLVILEDPNPFLVQRARALDVLQNERITIYPGVPFAFRLLADAPGTFDLSTLRLCFSAGTALPRQTFDSFHHRFGVPVRQLYGCTEAGALAINLDDDPSASAESVGRPFSGVSIRVVDETRRPVGVGESGEVAISTAAMTLGYQGMDELNREVFRDGFFYTGDVGRIDGDGRLWITGRKKLFIDVAGNKVDPVELEDVLVMHPSVGEAVVVGAPGPAPGEEIVKAVIVVTSPVTDRELIRWCSDRLARYKVPRIVEFRDEIPKSPLGKVLRKYLV